MGPSSIAGACKAVALIALGLLNCPSSANADWQYTQWGMSPEQAMAASSGFLRKATAKEVADNTIPPIGSALVVGEYATNNIKFSATLLFDANKLSGVHLRPVDMEDVERIFGLTTAIYGKPDTTKDEWKDSCREVVKEWRDSERKNDVTFRFRACVATGRPLSKSASLVYSRVIPKAGAGL